ncbi:MAG: S24/S26 family peptidase [Oscillospiraceae bacterium]|nr:S24/S26 family peptidase [Oscillospiraceae bacterium]
MFQETAKKRKPLQIVGIIVVVILALAIVSTFVIYGIFKDSNSAPMVFGKRVYIMSGTGMEPKIPQGSAVFVDEGVLPESEGNVILCNIDGKLALVRCVGLQTTTAEDGTVATSYIVKYDSTSADQQWTVDAEDIIGRAVSYDTFLGKVITFASSKVGMLVIVIVPCALLILYEVIMLIISVRKRKTTEEEAIEDMSFGDAGAFTLSHSEKPEKRVSEERKAPTGNDILDFGFTNEKKTSAKKEVPLFDFGDFTPKYTHSDEDNSSLNELDFSFGSSSQKAKEPDISELEEAVAPKKADEEPFVWHPVVSTPEPAKAPEPTPEPAPKPTVSETTSKLDEVAKSLKSNESAQATSSRIDELIKLLEEEKARLAGEDKK